MHHDTKATGHPGQWKTYELVSQNYWWPGMSTFVKNYIEGCATCQETKKLPKTTVPLQPNEIPANVWQITTMDFIVDLPLSQGFDSLLVVVDRFSKATIIIPCHKTITAEQTADLYLEHVWKRTGLPQKIISDRGPQFAAKVIQELWKHLGVKSALSTAYHPQTDGETERVNQELEQYLRIFCNFQQDNWSQLIPFMEFAHNARPHHATRKPPFEIWYGFTPTFIPPLSFATKFPAVEERLRHMERMRSEVTAALNNAAEIMKSSRPDGPTYRFNEGDSVWLEATNLKTTHPKAKLAPKRYGPFKVLAAYPVNSKLALPKSWRIHPVFHNALLKPYKETPAHGPNYTRPPPEIIDDEGEHYEVETILKSRATPNRRGLQYLVKWKGYPASENSWVAAGDMKNAPKLTTAFHSRYPNMPKIIIRTLSLQAQTDLKEGILSRIVTSRIAGSEGNGRDNTQRPPCNQRERPSKGGQPQLSHNTLQTPNSLTKPYMNRTKGNPLGNPLRNPQSLKEASSDPDIPRNRPGDPQCHRSGSSDPDIPRNRPGDLQCHRSGSLQEYFEKRSGHNPQGSRPQPQMPRITPPPSCGRSTRASGIMPLEHQRNLRITPRVIPLTRVHSLCI